MKFTCFHFDWFYYKCLIDNSYSCFTLQYIKLYSKFKQTNIFVSFSNKLQTFMNNFTGQFEADKILNINTVKMSSQKTI